MKPSNYAGRLVCAVAVLWIAGNAIVLPWTGRSYSADGMQPGVMRPSGGFGLEGDSGFARWRPLWNPPLPHSSSIMAAVRWPWQTVPVQASVHCIEVDVLTWLASVSSGLVTFGFLASLLTPATLPIREQQWIHLIWCWAWSLLSAFTGFLLTWLVVSQWGTSPSDGVTLLGFAALLTASAIYSLRYSYLAQIRSPDEALALRDDLTTASKASWWQAASMVSGLVAGGAAGWGAAIVLIWILPSQPSPDSPGLGGLGAAIGQLILSLGGLVSGSLVGVSVAYWWRRSRPNSTG